MNSTVSFESQHLKRPAMAAALAGSTKIPSCRASHIWAVENFVIRHDVNCAARLLDAPLAACFQLAGLPIRMADAIVSGCSTIRL